MISYALQDKALYEVLHEEANVIRGRLNDKRIDFASHELDSCTFKPQLVANQIVKESRVMKVCMTAHNAWLRMCGGCEMRGLY